MNYVNALALLPTLSRSLKIRNVPARTLHQLIQQTGHLAARAAVLPLPQTPYLSRATSASV